MASHIVPDLDAPHALLRIHDRAPERIHLLRTNQPERYPAADVLATAPAIDLDGLVATIKAQQLALMSAAHALRAGTSAAKIRETLATSVCDYTRAVGLGVSPANIALFCEPSGSIFILDTLARIPAAETSPNELILLLSGQRLVLVGIFVDGSPQLHKKIAISQPDGTVTSAVRRPLDAFVSADIQCMPELELGEFHVTVPVMLPDATAGPLTVVELPCAWLIFFNVNGQLACSVVATTDIRCKLLLRIATDEAIVAVTVVVSSHYLCRVCADKPLRGAIRGVTASFLRHENDRIILLPCIL